MKRRCGLQRCPHDSRFTIHVSRFTVHRGHRKRKKRPDDAGSASSEPSLPDVPCAPPLELYVLPDGGRLYRENLYGAEGSRTPGLCSAIAALSQLSYSPESGARHPSIRSGRTPALTTRPRSRGAGPSTRKLPVPGRKSTHSHTRRRWEFQRNSANRFCLRTPSLPHIQEPAAAAQRVAGRSHHGSGLTEVLRRPAWDDS